MRLADFLNVLETLAPSEWAEPWDNPGLQVGCPSQEITRVFSSLDPTLEALQSASKANAQLLFTHHPLIFKPLGRIHTRVFPGNVISEAIRRDMAIVAAHTNLDVAPKGINAILADLLDLEEVAVLKPVGGLDGVGLGRIGNLPHPMPVRELAATVMHILGAPGLQIVGDPDKRIYRLAVVGGSGGGLVSLAREKGADLLLTGDVGHHVALEARALGIALMDGGHFHSEKTAFRFFCGALEHLLRSNGTEVRVIADEGERNPILRYERQ